MKSEEYKPAFALIAPYYDVLMSFVDYPSWIVYIDKILRLHNIKEKTILDLACGTGVCLELWRQKGYRVIGLDRSMAMLQVCKERFSHEPDNTVHLINGDMRVFGLTNKLPIITCLYDSLNHLLTIEDLFRCLQDVYDILKTKGIFIFDMNTVHCLRDEWRDSTFYRTDKNINSIWTNEFNPATYISSLKITLNIHENGTVKTIHEFHQERAYRLSTITALLRRLGFTCELYRHLTFNPAQESDVRIMGVAIK